MSFSSDQKRAIMNMHVKNACCRRAFLQAVMAVSAHATDDAIAVRLENREKAEYIACLVQEFYGRAGDLRPPENGGRYVLLTFKSPAVARLLADAARKNELHTDRKCPGCTAAALRGIFFAIGRVSDPSNQYCLEFSPKDRMNIVAEYLNVCGICPKLTERAAQPILLIKNSTEIEDFFALAGMNEATFGVMNSKIENEFRNNANRIANCETNNIEKAVSASQRHIAAIERLQAAGKFSMLPEELEYTARMRMTHRDLSLSQLAAICVPPLSKPGISHRLNRIVKFADEILKDRADA